ncbi:MAG: PilZ domain-containing protein, partial [bacterium]
ITRDFSSSGIFFETDKSFTPGQAIEFTMVLEHVDPQGPVRLKCIGEIIRVEEIGQKIGVAATIKSYSFEASGGPEKRQGEGGGPKEGGGAEKIKGKCK